MTISIHTWDKSFYYRCAAHFKAYGYAITTAPADVIITDQWDGSIPECYLFVVISADETIRDKLPNSSMFILKPFDVDVIAEKIIGMIKPK